MAATPLFLQALSVLPGGDAFVARRLLDGLGQHGRLLREADVAQRRARPLVAVQAGRRAELERVGGHLRLDLLRRQVSSQLSVQAAEGRCCCRCIRCWWKV